MRPLVMSDALVAQMCHGLGASLPTDEADLDLLFERWKQRVPFDPIAKALAAQQGTRPPGADPTEFCERWLATGVGGTCWGHVAGLAALLNAAGLRTRIGLDRMLIDGVDFHSFLLVDLPTDVGSRVVVLDPIHAADRPLPFVPGATGASGPYRVGISGDDGRIGHWFVHPERPDRTTRYAVLSTELDADDVRAFCEISGRFTGVVSDRLFFRRFEPGALVQGRPGRDGRSFVLTTWTDDGTHARKIVTIDELQQALGYNDAGIALAEQAGLLRVSNHGLEFTGCAPS